MGRDPTTPPSDSQQSHTSCFCATLTQPMSTPAAHRSLLSQMSRTCSAWLSPAPTRRGPCGPVPSPTQQRRRRWRWAPCSTPTFRTVLGLVTSSCSRMTFWNTLQGVIAMDPCKHLSESRARILSTVRVLSCASQVCLSLSLLCRFFARARRCAGGGIRKFKSRLCVSSLC
jgi:hypothetical protein